MPPGLLVRQSMTHWKEHKMKAKLKADRKVTLFLIILAVAVTASLAAWYFLSGRGPSSSGDEEIYVMKVSDITGGSHFSVDRFSGVVESQQTVDYKKSGDAKIEEIYVTVGQTIEAGAPLFKYDITDAQNKVDMTNLEIEGLNQEIAALQNSGASDTGTQLQIIQYQTEIKSKQVSVQGYQQQIDQAVVSSKVKGIVKAVNETGQDPNGSEAAVVSVTELGEFRIKGKINEQQIAVITAGQSVIIRSRIDETKTWSGTVSKIDTEPAANNNEQYGMYGPEDSSSRATQYPFYISLDKTDGLMLGQHVFIEPDYGQNKSNPQEGLWLDSFYIMTDEDGSSYVWVSENGKLKKRTVELGETDDEKMTVEIKDGLTNDDYIAWPDDTLKEGTKTVSDMSTEVN